MTICLNSVYEFLKAIVYCISLSWESSKAYTSIRLLGKMIRPITGIVSVFLLKYIIDLLSGNLLLPDSKFALVWLIFAAAIVSLLNVAVQKVVSYAEGVHNDIIDRHITIDMISKALSSDLSMFDNPAYYDKFTSVKRDLYATSYILWCALDCVSSFIVFVSTFLVLCTSNWLYGVIMLLAAFPSAIVGQKYTKIIYQLGLLQINDERKKGYIYEVASNKQYAQDIRLFGIG